MNILFIGDVVGKSGRKACKDLIPELRQKYSCSFVIANVENAANGAGVNAKCLDDLKDVVNVFTLGDHVWDQKNFNNEIAAYKNVIRPANFSNRQPGNGYCIVRNPACGEIAVINLLGKVFMRDSAYCPFEKVDEILAKIPKTVKTIFVDMHCEATSEKVGMGYYLDGRVTAVLGTHTHVQTADAKILPKGTAYITDAGMVGADFSVLGRTVESVLSKFETGMPCRLPVEEHGIRLDGAVVSFNLSDGKATAIKNISIMHNENY